MGIFVESAAGTSDDSSRNVYQRPAGLASVNSQNTGTKIKTLYILYGHLDLSIDGLVTSHTLVAVISALCLVVALCEDRKARVRQVFCFLAKFCFSINY
ncbi:MAG: hypothetical protein A3B98_04255 [Candidatus Taylorbacteria bacterium RIFCSPHIGHO2_02_FULL_43_55]|nr:MAG: hypothetical protein A3B98_04255 [Candidatus Taylorbacteria bacterium RIFCSPHIGHO2_02_FULL_43_55]